MIKILLIFALFCANFADNLDNLIIKFPNDIKQLKQIKFIYLDEYENEQEKIFDINASVQINDEFLFKKREIPQISSSIDVSVTLKEDIKSNGVQVELDLPFFTQNFGKNLVANFSKNKLNIITSLPILEIYEFPKIGKLVVDINKTEVKFDEKFYFDGTIFDNILFENHKDFDRILCVSKDKNLSLKKLKNGFEIGF